MEIDYQDHIIAGNTYDTIASIADIMRDFATMLDGLRSLSASLAPIYETLTSVSSLFKMVELFGEHQFVLVEPFPNEYFQWKRDDDIDFLAEKHFSSIKQVENTAALCELDNSVFTQALTAYRQGLYDLAIIGFTSVFDRVLTKNRGLIDKTNLKRQCEILLKDVNNNTDYFFDDPDAKNYILYLSYEKAVLPFLENSDFKKTEPPLLNRHWIMHGRTDRTYTRLDCVKVLNLIYGTIELDKLEKEYEEVGSDCGAS